MTPTREQIIEGRDEALECAHITPAEWDDLPIDQQRQLVRSWAGYGDLWLAVAQTVALAEAGIVRSSIASLGWSWLAMQTKLQRADRQSDYALQA